ncbi:hypothetical protein AB1Y20_020008 [Prymnesium parvum]|uniref:Fe2OG dioxygenase domain-containing protein n=1 Tax=Prymnesium parvum TaxID=97485 RepID=A0AB34JWB7_PRYPA
MARGRKAAPPPSLVLERAPHRSDSRRPRRRSWNGPASARLCLPALLAVVAVLAALRSFPPASTDSEQRESSPQALPSLSPEVLASVCEASSALPAQPAGSDDLAARRAALEAAAAELASSQRFMEAAAKYRDALELDPSSTTAHDGLMRAFHAIYGPPGNGPRDDRNRTDDFRLAMARGVASGTASCVSSDPPIYVLHKVVSREEASALLRLREGRRKDWSYVPPLVCFDHPHFSRHPKLQPYLQHGIGANGRRSCLNQRASAATSTVIQFSESLALYAGEEWLVDEVGRRLHERAGLDPLSGINFQLLSYKSGSAYHGHTDCDQNTDLLDARRPIRMASVLIYLTDSFDAGETEFTELGIKLRPEVGSAVVFYSYYNPEQRYGGRMCDMRTMHSARLVQNGEKHVLQRWYSYRSDPFFDVRPWRLQNDLRLRLPWQSVIKCDQVLSAQHSESVDQNLPDVSCRWYNKPYDFVHENA